VIPNPWVVGVSRARLLGQLAVVKRSPSTSSGHAWSASAKRHNAVSPRRSPRPAFRREYPRGRFWCRWGDRGLRGRASPRRQEVGRRERRRRDGHWKSPASRLKISLPAICLTRCSTSRSLGRTHSAPRAGNRRRRHRLLLLTGRFREGFIVGRPGSCRETIRRLTAYAEAGAECVYAPGLSRPKSAHQARVIRLPMSPPRLRSTSLVGGGLHRRSRSSPRPVAPSDQRRRRAGPRGCGPPSCRRRRLRVDRGAGDVHPPRARVAVRTTSNGLTSPCVDPMPPRRARRRERPSRRTFGRNKPRHGPPLQTGLGCEHFSTDRHYATLATLNADASACISRPVWYPSFGTSKYSSSPRPR
jgi:hypothetical protein